MWRSLVQRAEPLDTRQIAALAAAATRFTALLTAEARLGRTAARPPMATPAAAGTARIGEPKTALPAPPALPATLPGAGIVQRAKGDECNGESPGQRDEPAPRPGGASQTVHDVPRYGAHSHLVPTPFTTHGGWRLPRRRRARADGQTRRAVARAQRGMKQPIEPRSLPDAGQIIRTIRTLPARCQPR